MNNWNLGLFIFISFLMGEELPAQKWDFVKEKDGIKIYTRLEPNSSLKSYMGVVDLQAPVEKINSMMGNPDNFDWWDKDIKEIKVIGYEPEKFIKYYLVYDVPWPLTDRDLVVEAKITRDPVTGKRVVHAQPLPNVIPEKKDLIRIKKYWQKWTVQPMDKGIVHVTLEGFVDPGGSIPAWLYNMVITETPLKVIREVKSRVETKSSH
jgi:hypothetical protein